MTDKYKSSETPSEVEVSNKKLSPQKIKILVGVSITAAVLTIIGSRYMSENKADKQEKAFEVLERATPPEGVEPNDFPTYTMDEIKKDIESGNTIELQFPDKDNKPIFKDLSPSGEPYPGKLRKYTGEDIKKIIEKKGYTIIELPKKK